MKLVVNVYGERRHFVIPRDARKTMRLSKGDYVMYRVLEINDKPAKIDFLQSPPIIGKAMVAGMTSMAMSMYPTFKELLGIKPGDRLLIDVIAVIKKYKGKHKVIWIDDANN